MAFKIVRRRGVSRLSRARLFMACALAALTSTAAAANPPPGIGPPPFAGPPQTPRPPLTSAAPLNTGSPPWAGAPPTAGSPVPFYAPQPIFAPSTGLPPTPANQLNVGLPATVESPSEPAPGPGLSATSGRSHAAPVSEQVISRVGSPGTHDGAELVLNLGTFDIAGTLLPGPSTNHLQQPSASAALLLAADSG